MQTILVCIYIHIYIYFQHNYIIRNTSLTLALSLVWLLYIRDSSHVFKHSNICTYMYTHMHNTYIHTYTRTEVSKKYPLVNLKSHVVIILMFELWKAPLTLIELCREFSDTGAIVNIIKERPVVTLILEWPCDTSMSRCKAPVVQQFWEIATDQIIQLKQKFASHRCNNAPPHESIAERFWAPRHLWQ